MYTISTIESYSEFLALESEWEEFRLRNNFSLFSSYSWYWCLLSSYQNTIKPFIIIVRCSISHKIMGILPLKKDRKYFIPGLVSLVDIDTHCFDLICDRSSQEDVLVDIFNFISNLKGINYVVFTPVAEKDSPLWEFLFNNKNSTLDIVKRSPYLHCNQTFENIFKLKSKVSRKNTRNLINRFSKFEAVSIEKLTFLNEADFKDCLSISGGSWKGEVGSDIGSSEITRKFFRVLSAVASRRGWLRVTFLRVNGKRVAMEYHLREGNVEYALRGDYLTLFKEHSPGRYLEFFIIKDLCDEGEIEIYDMCGGQYGYKEKWTKLTEKYYRAILFTNCYIFYLYKAKRLFDRCKRKVLT